MGRIEKNEFKQNIKRKIDRAIIDKGQKAGTGAIASIENNIDCGNKITDWDANFVDFIFTTFVTVNYASNSNFASSKGMLLSTTIFTSNQFIIIC